jgi:hypothetical protein
MINDEDAILGAAIAFFNIDIWGLWSVLILAVYVMPLHINTPLLQSRSLSSSLGGNAQVRRRCPVLPSPCDHAHVRSGLRWTPCSHVVLSNSEALAI